jgi:hypothetical protein
MINKTMRPIIATLANEDAPATDTTADVTVGVIITQTMA